MDTDFKISVVVPVFNEAQNLGELTGLLSGVLGAYRDNEIIFVDDGSTDATLVTIKSLQAAYPTVRFISFSRNFGHSMALRAGLDHASGDCVVSMDGDLQHPPALITELVAKWKAGVKIVSTQRLSAPTLSFKAITSSFFYKSFDWLSGLPIGQGRADFRLLDKQVVDVIRMLPEKNIFIRGLIPWLGFSQACIEYKPAARFSGKSKFSLKKMILLGLDGVTAHSVRPLHLTTLIGVVISIFSFFYVVFAVYARFRMNLVVPGWASIVVCVLFMGSVQMIVIGILGEYIGRIFMEGKQRPNYLVQESHL